MTSWPNTTNWRNRSNPAANRRTNNNDGWRASAFIGFWIAYQWDYPIGPTDVVLLGIIYALGFTMKKLAFLFRQKSPA
jgi:hypothetical protein